MTRGAAEATALDAPIAVTMGEPAGIGTEITALAWARHGGELPPFFLIGDPDSIANATDVNIAITVISEPAEAFSLWPEALPVLPLALSAPVTPGRPDIANAPAVIAAIDQAANLAMSGAASAIVTNPIQKSVLYEAGFTAPGHTEYLAQLANSTTSPVMMLAGPELRVVPVSIHTSLAQAAASLRQSEIVHCARITAAALQDDFAIARPRLAVAGLNPHAGEGGALGREEIGIIEPAIAEIRSAGIDVFGPAAADALFHADARKTYDAAICMYHDQALIPLKTLDFHRSVNVTLGLPIVRTSPDHGTALDIAGTGRANPTSFVEAVKLAGSMATRRRQSKAAA